MKLVALLLLGLSLAVPGHAANVVWRSSSSGVLPLVVPPDPEQPEGSSGFTATMAGKASVAVGGVLDLRPVITGASGMVSFLLIGSLPPGAHFNPITGALGGRALEPGTYSVRVSVVDERGAVAVATATIVVG